MRCREKERRARGERAKAREEKARARARESESVREQERELERARARARTRAREQRASEELECKEEEEEQEEKERRRRRRRRRRSMVCSERGKRIGRGGSIGGNRGKGSGLSKAKAMNEVDAGRDRATPASVRHDDDRPVTFIFSCYCTRAVRPADCQTSLQ